jgi:hypothetical protein
MHYFGIGYFGGIHSLEIFVHLQLIRINLGQKRINLIQFIDSRISIFFLLFSFQLFLNRDFPPYQTPLFINYRIFQRIHLKRLKINSPPIIIILPNYDPCSTWPQKRNLH